MAGTGGGEGFAAAAAAAAAALAAAASPAGSVQATIMVSWSPASRGYPSLYVFSIASWKSASDAMALAMEYDLLFFSS